MELRVLTTEFALFPVEMLSAQYLLYKKLILYCML